MITPVDVGPNLPAKCRCYVGDRYRAHIMAMAFLSNKEEILGCSPWFRLFVLLEEGRGIITYTFSYPILHLSYSQAALTGVLKLGVSFVYIPPGDKTFHQWALGNVLLCIERHSSNTYLLGLSIFVRVRRQKWHNDFFKKSIDFPLLLQKLFPL